MTPPSKSALACVISLGLLAGCSPDSGSQNGATAERSSQSRGVIGISVLTLTNPFFQVLAQNAEAEAAEHGYDMFIHSGEFDVAKQRDQIKDFIVQKVAAIILCPCDSKSIGPAIREANEAGIPVFTADIACLAPEAEVVTHVATDNYGGGKQAARAMIEALGDSGGKVVIIDYKSVESCILRVKGFKEVIEAHNASEAPGEIDIVAELPGEGQRDRGFKAAQDALQAHPDLAGIFAINDPSALGAHRAVEKAGKAEQVVLISFDGQPEGKQAVDEGKFFAEPVQFPDRIGRTVVESVVRHFNGEELPEEQLIPTELYRGASTSGDTESDE